MVFPLASGIASIGYGPFVLSIVRSERQCVSFITVPYIGLSSCMSEESRLVVLKHWYKFASAVPKYSGNPDDFLSWLHAFESSIKLGTCHDERVESLFTTSEIPIPSGAPSSSSSSSSAGHTPEKKALLIKEYVLINEALHGSVFFAMPAQDQKPEQPAVLYSLSAWLVKEESWCR